MNDYVTYKDAATNEYIFVPAEHEQEFVENHHVVIKTGSVYTDSSDNIEEWLDD